MQHHSIFGSQKILLVRQPLVRGHARAGRVVPQLPLLSHPTHDRGDIEEVPLAPPDCKEQQHHRPEHSLDEAEREGGCRGGEGSGERGKDQVCEGDCPCDCAVESCLVLRE